MATLEDLIEQAKTNVATGVKEFESPEGERQVMHSPGELVKLLQYLEDKELRDKAKAGPPKIGYIPVCKYRGR